MRRGGVASATSGVDAAVEGTYGRCPAAAKGQAGCCAQGTAPGARVAHKGVGQNPGPFGAAIRARSSREEIAVRKRGGVRISPVSSAMLSLIIRTPGTGDPEFLLCMCAVCVRLVSLEGHAMHHRTRLPLSHLHYCARLQWERRGIAPAIYTRKPALPPQQQAPPLRRWLHLGRAARLVGGHEWRPLGVVDGDGARNAIPVFGAKRHDMYTVPLPPAQGDTHTPPTHIASLTTPKDDSLSQTRRSWGVERTWRPREHCRPATAENIGILWG